MVETRKFWYNYVDTKEPPPITTKDNLDRIYKTIEGSRIESTEVMAEKVKEYHKVGVKIKELQDAQNELKQVIKLYMGTHETLEHLGTRLVTNKSCTRKTLPVESIKKHYPQIYNKFIKESSYKRLTINQGAVGS